MKIRYSTCKVYYIQNDSRCEVIFDPGQVSLLERFFDSIKPLNSLIIKHFIFPSRHYLLVSMTILPGLVAAASHTSPAKTTTNSIGMEFVLIPAGTFQMGSNDGDTDEKPVHQTTISRAYYMGRYEVTQTHWQAIMGKNPSLFQGDPTNAHERVHDRAFVGS